MEEYNAELATVLGLGAEQVAGVAESVAGWTVAVQIKALNRLSHGFRNRDRYRLQRLLGFLSPTAMPHLLT